MRPVGRSGSSAGGALEEPRGLACLVPWVTGSDPGTDGLVRLAAARLGASGRWEGLELATRPFAGDLPAALAARVQRELGLDAAELQHAPRPSEAWPRVREFLGARVVLAPDAELASTWIRALDASAGIAGEGAHAAAPIELLGLDEVARLLVPGRLAQRRDALVRALLPAEAAPAHPGALLPPHVLFALADVVARFQARGPVAAAVAALGFGRAASAFDASDPDAARALRAILALADRPSAHLGADGSFHPALLEDGWLERARELDAGDDDPLALLEPAWAELDDGDDAPPLPPAREGPTPFDPEDLRTLDEVFRVHLPALFEGGSGRYRKSQHRLAESIARSFGDEEVLLVHAPTGTGKTLAYLLPALLWARRHGVRVGVATYTRALQEQARSREVPRALAALGRAGVAPGFRVTSLEGREHSLCWRALRAATPVASDDAETWLAWTTLAMFAIGDADGDLGAVPRRPAVRLAAMRPWHAQLASMLRLAGARPECCTRAEDRRTCAAEVARRRAERSHVVVTNHSFVLARPEFFRRVVFDECEHLHDQAAGAHSTRYPLATAFEAAARLHVPGDRRGRAALDRLKRAQLADAELLEHVDAAAARVRELQSALGRLEAELRRFERWRVERLAHVEPRDEHALFRAYAALAGGAGDADEREGASALLEVRAGAAAAAARIDSLLASIAERLPAAGLRRAGRMQRHLELGRRDMSELGHALAEWLPIDEGRPRFAASLFHDVERDAQGDPVLSARVLLPDRLLGRRFLPQFSTAVLVSAASKLGGSFDAARRYLGLDLLAKEPESAGAEPPEPTAGELRVVREEALDAEPALDLEDAPSLESAGESPFREVRTASAPEVFDYSRVLVALPRDLPAPHRERARWLEHVAAWLPWLAERTRGRILGLFTSLDDVRWLGERVAPEFRARNLPLHWQGMAGSDKEELAELFRDRVEATLLGVDTFWYGADFPGETLEVLLLARLPFGVPDRYHHAQCAALGEQVQRQRIYMPRALAKFRQGFGRLMRRASDRGVVVSLDPRLGDRRYDAFLRELPLARPGLPGGEKGARLVRGELARVTHEALVHLGLADELERSGLGTWFGPAREGEPRPEPTIRRADEPRLIETDLGDLPF